MTKFPGTPTTKGTVFKQKVTIHPNVTETVAAGKGGKECVPNIAGLWISETPPFTDAGSTEDSNHIYVPSTDLVRTESLAWTTGYPYDQEAVDSLYIPMPVIQCFVYLEGDTCCLPVEWTILAVSEGASFVPPMVYVGELGCWIRRADHAWIDMQACTLTFTAKVGGVTYGPVTLTVADPAWPSGV